MAVRHEAAVTEAMERHVRYAAAQAAKPGPGQSKTFTGPGVWTRLGRLHDGTYFVDACWPVMEAHDDDFGSRTCGCKRQGSPHAHCHRTADTLEGLLGAPTVGHGVLGRAIEAQSRAGA
jgi:hypothetical protein